MHRVHSRTWFLYLANAWRFRMKMSKWKAVTWKWNHYNNEEKQILQWFSASRFFSLLSRVVNWTREATTNFKPFCWEIEQVGTNYVQLRWNRFNFSHQMPLLIIYASMLTIRFQHILSQLCAFVGLSHFCDCISVLPLDIVRPKSYQVKKVSS